MKIDVQSLLGGKAALRQKASASASKKGEAVEFSAELEPRLTAAPGSRGQAKVDERREKKDRQPSAELLAHALLVPPPAPRIDTAQVKLKAAPTEANAVSTRAKAHTHELPVPTTEGKAHKKALPVEETSKPELAAKQTPDAPVPTASPEAAAPKFELPAVVAPKEAAPLAQVAPMMLEDPSLRAVILPTVARVSLEAGDAGRLNVQLKVNDGVTDIRASGPAAQLLESRQGELKVALAREGLALGHFDLTQSNSQQHHHSQPGAEGLDAPPTARRAARATSSEGGSTNANGHLHVKA